MLHALDAPRHLDELGPERGGDELRASVSLRAHHRGDRGAVLRVQRGVDLVEQVERHRVAPLDGEDQPDRDDGFLTAAELFHHHRLALPERNLDLDAAVLLGESPRRGVLLRLLGVGVLRAGALAGLLALHDQLTLAPGHELGEHLAEVQGHLLERALDGLILLLVQVRHQLADLAVRLVELAPADLHRLALLGELLVLVQRLLVDVPELRQLLVRLAQERVQRLERLASVPLERVRGQRPELANLALEPLALGLQGRPLRHQALHLALVVRHRALDVVLLIAQALDRVLAFLHVGRRLRHLRGELAVARARLRLLGGGGGGVRLGARLLCLHAHDVHLAGGGLDLQLPALEVGRERRLELAQFSLRGEPRGGRGDARLLERVQARVEPRELGELRLGQLRVEVRLRLLAQVRRLRLEVADGDADRRDRLLLDAEGLLRALRGVRARLRLRAEPLDGRLTVAPRRLGALDVAQHRRHRLLRRLQLILDLRALLAELGAHLLRLAEHAHVHHARAAGVLVAAADRAAVGHAVAVHGDAVQVRGARELHGDVEVAADQDVAEHLVQRGADLLVVADLAQHREHVLRVRVLAVTRAQAVERQKRHAAGFVLVQVLDDLGRHVVVVDDDVEQLVCRRRLDGGEEALVALHQLDQRAVYTLDPVVLHDALHRGEPAEQLARHGELQLLVAALHLLRLRVELGVNLRVAALQLLALVLRGVPRRDLRLVLLLGLAQLGLLLQELALDRALVLRLLLGGFLQVARVAVQDADLVALARERRLAIRRLRLEPRVALSLGLELRAAALPLVQHLQPTGHLAHLRGGALLARRLGVRLGARGGDLGPRLRHGAVQPRLLAAHARERLLAGGDLLCELPRVQVARGLSLYRAAQLDVRGQQLLLGRRQRALLVLALALRRLHLIAQPVRALVFVARLVHVLPAPLLALVQLGARLAEVLLVHGVLQRAPRAVQLGVHLQLVLLLVELGEARLDEVHRLLDLVAARLGVLHDLQGFAPLVLVHTRAPDFLQEIETLLVLHGCHLHDLALLHAVIRVRAREPRRLQEVDHLRLGDVLLVQVVLVLLEADVPAQTHFLAVHGQAVVRVVEHDLRVRAHHRVPGALVQELLPLIRAQRAEDVREHEANRVEQVGLAGTVRADCEWWWFSVRKSWSRKGVRRGADAGRGRPREPDLKRGQFEKRAVPTKSRARDARGVSWRVSGE